jgi:N-acetylmuramoyl-L-alanine amidase
VRRLPGDPRSGTPPRVVVEFARTRPGPRLTMRLTPAGGPLVRLGASALGGDVTRVVLDVPGLSEHRAFTLPDPFRLVVDVHGTPRAIAEASPSKKGAPGGFPPRATAANPALPPSSKGGSDATRKHRWRIVVDPGHGGKDPGAIGVSGVREKDVVLDLSRRLARRLRRAGHDVVLTREADVFLSLPERTTLANAARADLFLSVHANASDNRAAAGIETYYLSNSGDRATVRLAEMENHLAHMTERPPATADVAWIVSDMIQSYKVEESVQLARGIQREVVRSLRSREPAVRDLGAKPGPFHVLVGAGMPAVLLEAGFLTEASDARRLADPAYLERLCEGLLLAIDKFIENIEITSTL